MAITLIRREMRSLAEDCEENYNRWYDSNGDLVEERVTAHEADTADGCWTRVSRDNGRTFGEWKKCFSDAEDGGPRGMLPNGDQILGGVSCGTYDPVSGCTVGVGTTIYYIKGHKIGYFAMWEKGEDDQRFHGYFAFRRPDGTEVKRLLTFEEGGVDFHEDMPDDPAFLDRNRCAAFGLQTAPDGDLLFLVQPVMTLCCRMAGVDVGAYFPSCPNLQMGLMVARAHWDADASDYTITYSNPVMLSDLQSSRGVMEPTLVRLNSGRLLLVFRGSTLQLDCWHTRIDPGAPGYRWYAVSDDDGRSFSPSMPWHFDDRTAVYSPASISSLFRSTKTGKLYFIGNIADDPSLIDGNTPRWPLQICEVDEDYGFLRRDTLTVIDTKREHESFYVELSNFNLLENRETMDLEIRLSKINGRITEPGQTDFYTEAWEYVLRLE